MIPSENISKKCYKSLELLHSTRTQNNHLYAIIIPRERICTVHSTQSTNLYLDVFTVILVESEPKAKNNEQYGTQEYCFTRMPNRLIQWHFINYINHSRHHWAKAEVTKSQSSFYCTHK